jgi:hypothetical protein
MGQYECGYHTSKKWYKRNIFPIIPIIETRKGNKYNTDSFSFRWLFITIWTIDSFCFELSLVANNHWGIGIIGLFPYFRFAFTIPCPISVGMWTQKNLDRKPIKHRGEIE